MIGLSIRFTFIHKNNSMENKIMLFASNKIESFILGILDDLEAIALVNMPRMMERVLALSTSWEKREKRSTLIFGFSTRSRTPRVSYRWGAQRCVTVDITFVSSLLVSHNVQIWKINQTRINSEKIRKRRLFGASFTHVWNSYQRCYFIVFWTAC